MFRADIRRFSLAEFRDYVAGLDLSWRPSLVCLHHTFRPSDPDDFDARWRARMAGLQAGYQANGWHAGPHLFLSRRWIYQLTPLTVPGVHARSYNGTAWGVEMVGNFGPGPGYPKEPGRPIPNDQRMLAVAVCAALVDKIDRSESAVVFHRDDPKTSKTCPGTYVDRRTFRLAVAAALADPQSAPAILAGGRPARGFVEGGCAWIAARDLAAAAGGSVTWQDGTVRIHGRGGRVIAWNRDTYRQVSGVTYIRMRDAVTALGGTIGIVDGRILATWPGGTS